MSKYHFIQPYSMSSPPNIGGSINEAIEQLHAEANDWVILTDHDVCWLRADSKRQLIEILGNTEYDVLGATTNRLANDYQLAVIFNGIDVFDNTDIKFHVEIADYLHKRNYGKVQEYPHVLAAFCLCFKINSWLELGKFTEKTIAFDTEFSLAAQESGMKLGLMTGIYLWHSYRLTSDNPKYDVSHLI